MQPLPRDEEEVIPDSATPSPTSILPRPGHDVVMAETETPPTRYHLAAAQRAYARGSAPEEDEAHPTDGGGDSDGDNLGVTYTSSQTTTIIQASSSRRTVTAQQSSTSRHNSSSSVEIVEVKADKGKARMRKASPEAEAMDLEDDEGLQGGRGRSRIRQPSEGIASAHNRYTTPPPSSRQDDGIYHFSLYICRSFNKINLLDVHMQSPPAKVPAEGSSRSTGGTMRGRAYGNQPNVADMPRRHEDDLNWRAPEPQPGRIYLYDTDENPSTVNHEYIKPMQINVKDIFDYQDYKQLVARAFRDWSPPRRKCFYSCIVVHYLKP